MKKLVELREKLEDVKRLNISIAKEYGSEIPSEELVKKERILENEIKELEKVDTTMYLLFDDDKWFKKANSVGVYTSNVGEGIHFKKTETYSNNVITSDEDRFWDILNKSATELYNEKRNLEFSLRSVNTNINLIDKAYKLKE